MKRAENSEVCRQGKLPCCLAWDECVDSFLGKACCKLDFDLWVAQGKGGRPGGVTNQRELCGKGVEGWRQRLAWRSSKTPERNVCPWLDMRIR